MQLINTLKMYNNIYSPIVTEKSLLSIEKNNIYIFKVSLTTNKLELKQFIENMFNVKVISVNCLINKGKNKIFKNRYHGKRKDFKKAYVKLPNGTKIDFNNINI